MVGGKGTAGRSPRQVLNDHLAKALAGEVEADIRDNISPDIVILTRDGVHRGHEAVRRLACRLDNEVPNARFAYRVVLVEGELGYLEWDAQGDGARISDGADSYVIRDGRIVGQTIHYRVHRAD